MGVSRGVGIEDRGLALGIGVGKVHWFFTHEFAWIGAGGA